ncbi:3-oxoacyl-ACP synthase [Lentzea alba]|uniref:3-oxoacyl-[acyl-carrier-protein] synthase III C-terminal domain-containing protein n=1 Tax=Lentzea alba TaxID=2714351 RepID=UPI0039BFEEF3
MTGIGLSRLAISVPDTVDSVEEVLRASGSSASEIKVFTRMFKLRDSPSWPLDQQMDDLLVEAGRRALADGGGADLVLYGHSLMTQEVSLRPGFAQRVLKQLDLEATPFFGISGVACTAPLRAVDLARDYVRKFPERKVLVLAGDLGATTSVARVIPRLTVLGDALGAFTVAREGVRYRHVASASRTDPRFRRGMRMDADDLRLFGRACAELVLDVLAEAANTAGIAIKDVDWVMPHLVNALAWKVFSEQVGIPHERFLLDLLPSQGHVYGLDALTSLEYADRLGKLRPGDLCALLSVGQGAYFHALIVEVVEEE